MADRLHWYGLSARPPPPPLSSSSLALFLDIYLSRRHSLPLNCSVASVPLLFSVFVFAMRSDLLHRLQMWDVASFIIAKSNDENIRRLNQVRKQDQCSMVISLFAHSTVCVVSFLPGNDVLRWSV